MDQKMINGLHHITSISGSARNNVRFYTEILGMQFVKRTINYDSTDTWHLYYGNRAGDPGSITTFFPFTGITKGKSGNQSVVSAQYSVAEGSLDFWMERLKTHHIGYRGPFNRFDEQYIQFDDFDGIHIELVFNRHDQRLGSSTAGISKNHGIKGLYSVTLSYASSEATLGFLTRYMDHHIANQTSERIRLFSGENKPGHFLDIISRPAVPNQVAGTGTVHHLAFQTSNETSQIQLQSQLTEAGINVSDVMDRQYFKSVYFREPGGVLFEIATSGPGFLIDESLDTLGENLMLPHWLEDKRHEIEAALSPL